MLEKLACSLGRNDEQPNIDLAVELVEANDKKGIREIVSGLGDVSEKVNNDCIKVLYEIGERKPALIADYVSDFIELLQSKNNRLVWGAMTALSHIAALKAKEIFDRWDIVYNAYRKGSVITVDTSISVFAGLVRADRGYGETVFPVLLKHLEECRPKEVGQHSERAFVCIHKDNAEPFKRILTGRLSELTVAQRKRVDRILKKVEEGEFVE